MVETFAIKMNIALLKVFAWLFNILFDVNLVVNGEQFCTSIERGPLLTCIATAVE